MALQPKKIRVLLIYKNLLIFPFAYVEMCITLLLYCLKFLFVQCSVLQMCWCGILQLAATILCSLVIWLLASLIFTSVDVNQGIAKNTEIRDNS